MDAQICTDFLPYILQIPIFGYFFVCHEHGGVSLYYIFVLSLKPFVSNNVSQLQGLPTSRAREKKKRL